MSGRGSHAKRTLSGAEKKHKKSHKVSQVMPGSYMALLYAHDGAALEFADAIPSQKPISVVNI